MSYQNENKMTIPTTKLELSFSCLEAGKAASILKDLGSFSWNYECKMERTWSNTWDLGLRFAALF